MASSSLEIFGQSGCASRAAPKQKANSNRLRVRKRPSITKLPFFLPLLKPILSSASFRYHRATAEHTDSSGHSVVLGRLRMFLTPGDPSISKTGGSTPNRRDLRLLIREKKEPLK